MWWRGGRVRQPDAAWHGPIAANLRSCRQLRCGSRGRPKGLSGPGRWLRRPGWYPESDRSGRTFEWWDLFDNQDVGGGDQLGPELLVYRSRRVVVSGPRERRSECATCGIAPSWRPQNERVTPPGPPWSPEDSNRNDPRRSSAPRHRLTLCIRPGPGGTSNRDRWPQSTRDTRSPLSQTPASRPGSGT